MIVDLIVHGDLHLDLKTDGIDRNEDIMKSMNEILEYSKEVKEENENTIVLNAGDVFHNTRPKAETIAVAISLFEKFNNFRIENHIIAGNHDVIDERGRTSALEPIIAANFKHINIYHDIELICLRECNTIKGSGKEGRLNLITIPHISKSKAVESGFKTVQDYINTKCEEIEEGLNKKDYNIVLSHMNIGGALIGSENMLIKGTHEDFPDIFKRSDKIYCSFNGHYHKSQLLNTKVPIVITGSVSTNDFGERLDNKNFFHLKLEL